jgi:iron complex transport system substrate-binding protein
LLACLALSPTSAQDKPQRIASLNLCTDQMLMLLVERERIATVTALAADPHVSAMAAEAVGLPVNHGSAEEVILHDPDLVLAGVYTTRPTVSLLRRLGYRVVELAPETSLADIRANLLALGDAVGEPERAATLAAELDAALAALVAPEAGERPVFADIQPNGWVSGGGTLVADVAHAAGFDTLGERLGYQGTRQVSLEQLAVSAPDALAIGDAWDGAPALAAERQRHPMLARLAAGRAAVEVPEPLWACGGPFTLEAVARIAAARAAVAP